MSFKYLLTLGFVFFIHHVTAQELKQNIRGQIKDKATHLVLEGVNVVAIPTDPVMGDRSDKDGRFEIRQLPIGRYSLQFTYLGYNSV
nr:carboxypeptidase-like regulatory domain-containing protein [Chitinophagaceae bacterium]